MTRRLIQFLLAIAGEPRGRYRLTAAMRAGITDEQWTMDRLNDEMMA